MSSIPRPQLSSRSPPPRHGLAPTSPDDLPSCGVTEPPLQGNHPSGPQSPSEDPAEVSESLTGWQAPESASPAGMLRRRLPRGLRPPTDTSTSPLTAEQRLLLLDTWLRSGLPAADFAALVGLSKHTLYAWKRKFQSEGPAGLADHPRREPGHSPFIVSTHIANIGQNRMDPAISPHHRASTRLAISSNPST